MTALNQASSTQSIVILGNLNTIGLLDVADTLPTITGTSDSDVLRGTNGNDVISGLEGRDTLFGGVGNDILIGGFDSDRLIGGAGRDRFVFNNFDERTDTIVDFNVIQDTLVLSDLFSQPLDEDVAPIADGYVQFVQDGLSTRVQVDPDGVGDFPFTTIAILDNVNAESLTAVVLNDLGTASSEGVIDCIGSDRLIGTNANNFLVSLEGDDTLIGGAGDDILLGGLGSDSETLLQADRFVFNNFNEQTAQVSDFNVYQDQLLLTNLLNKLNHNSIAPITDGYIQFAQQGLNTSIQVKSEGVDSLFQTVAILENVNAGDLVMPTI